MAKRFDTVKLDKGEITNNGFLRAPATLTRTGVFPYRRPDGRIVMELRHPDDVFHADAMATLSMCPVTDGHPEEGFVTPDNFKKLSIGYVSEQVKRNGDKLDGFALIADKNGIAKVQSGTVELSCGYLADNVVESGVYNGQKYDERQTNIRYNHVALVERGRMGPTARLHLDAEDAEIVESTQKENAMFKIKIDGKDVEVTKEVYDAFMAEQKKRQDAEERAAAAEKKKAEDEEEEKKRLAKEKKDAEDAKLTAEQRAEKLQARLDAAEEKIAKLEKLDSAERIDAAVEERLSIRRVAEKVLGSEAKFDGKSNLDIMKEVVSKVSPKTDLNGKSDVYIRARFDAIAEEAQGRDERRTNLGNAFTGNDNRKADEFDSEAARKRAREEAAKAYTQPLAVTKK